jgi:hypothetical protein
MPVRTMLPSEPLVICVGNYIIHDQSGNGFDLHRKLPDGARLSFRTLKSAMEFADAYGAPYSKILIDGGQHDIVPPTRTDHSVELVAMNWTTLTGLNQFPAYEKWNDIHLSTSDTAMFEPTRKKDT